MAKTKMVLLEVIKWAGWLVAVLQNAIETMAQ